MPHPDRAVHLAPAHAAERSLATTAQEAAGLADADIDAVVAWAAGAATAVPLPAGGHTVTRWEWLATVAAQDLTVARTAEPHLDALAILAEAGRSDLHGPGRSWGVYAAEGPGVRLEADDGSGGWMLSGTKPWCSLAGHLSHALVTAWLDDERRGMFAVDLSDPSVTVDAAQWNPAGLARVATATVTMTDVPAVPVGGAGWYLDRPGFAWGGIGVAAVWFGGAVGLLRRMLTAAGRREPDQVALMHVGGADADLAAAAALLRASAEAMDAGEEAGVEDPALLAARTRQVVADAAERVLTRAGHALGPGPLATEPEHVRRVADLTLYLRQHHAERDTAALGRMLLQQEAT